MGAAFASRSYFLPLGGQSPHLPSPIKSDAKKPFRRQLMRLGFAGGHLSGEGGVKRGAV